MRSASEKAAALSALRNHVKQPERASQAPKKTLKLNTLVSSLLQVRTSLIFNCGIRVHSCSAMLFRRLASHRHFWDHQDLRNAIARISVNVFCYCTNNCLIFSITSGGCSMTSAASACNSSPFDKTISTLPFFASATSSGSFKVFS